MPSFHETRIDVIEFPRELPHELPLAVDDMSLAFHLGIRNQTMWWMIHAKKKMYKVFQLPKRGRPGRYRNIQNPIDALKNVQKNILARFLSPVPVMAHVGAYIPGRSCRDTAVQHVGKGVIISLDIKDFFPAVRRSMVKRYLHRTLGYGYRVASLLAELVTYTNFVPQGAPTSGLVANLVAHERFDQRILRDLKELDPQWTYTRYSDDIDLSHPEVQETDRLTTVVALVRDAVENAGFRLNQRKTKVEPRWKRQKVLGMVVNEKVNIPRYEYMRVRSIVHNCLVDGFENQYKRAGMKSAAGLRTHIRGKLAFFKQVDPTKSQRLKDQFDLACQVHASKKDNEVRFDG
jgi:RNA-directed DNA polymerase